MPSQLDTFSTAGAFTYTIPDWAAKLDVVVLGGGGGGGSGGAGFNNGGGGGAGLYASKTLVRGTDMGWGTRTLSGQVGAGGNGQPTAGSGGWSNGGVSVLAVESGGGGTGAAVASGTGTISGSWTHTPFGYDNYVVVAVSVVGAGIGFASATRSVTYGGVAMTSMGALNANNAAGNGWLEVFGLVITPDAGAKTVVATVTSATIAFTNLQASSSSYGNVTPNSGNTVLTELNSGSSTTPSCSGFQVSPGGMLVGAIFARNSTSTAFSTGVVGRYSDNDAAPSFFMTESSTLAVDFPYLTGGTLAATSPWAAYALSLNTTTAYGAGGVKGDNYGTTEQGSSPGNLSLNGQTYTGGAAAGTNNNSSTISGNAPGGGGAGTNGVFVGSGASGGSGGTGRVWIYAYGDRPAFFPMM